MRGRFPPRYFYIVGDLRHWKVGVSLCLKISMMTARQARGTTMGATHHPQPAPLRTVRVALLQTRQVDRLATSNASVPTQPSCLKVQWAHRRSIHGSHAAVQREPTSATSQGFR